MKNVQQDDIKIIRTQVPLIGPGEKFRAALINVDKHGKVTTEKRMLRRCDKTILNAVAG